MNESPAIPASSRAVAAPRSALWRIPVAWVQLALVLTPLLVVPFFRLVDPDYWWHLQTGELIARSGFISHDPFSWTAAGNPWVTHEWLSEVLLYWLQQTFGYWANALFFGALAMGAAVTAFVAGRDAGAGSRAAIGFSAALVLILGTYATVRPQEFSWFLFAQFFVIIQRRYAGKPSPVWALPLLMLAWANLHMGFVFGFGLLAAWCLALAWERLRGRPAALGEALLVSAACLLAAVVHPDGPRLLLYPLRYLTDAGATHSHVAEWQSPEILNPFHWPIFLGAALLAGAVVIGRPRAFQLLVAVAVIVLSLQAVRNAPFLALMLPAIAAPCLAKRWRPASRAADTDVAVPAGAAAALIALTLFTMTAVMLSWNSQPSLSQPDERNFPSTGATYIDRHYAGARVFNEYGWGGYLVHRWYPDTRVGIDGRTDFYGDRLMSEYYRIFLVEPGWQQTLDQWDPDVVLISRGSKLATELRRDPDWIEELSFDRQSVFVRRDFGRGGEDGD